MNNGHEPLSEPLEPKEARQVAEEIRKRMLVKPSQSETLGDVAHAMGAPPAVATEALRAVRERRVKRPTMPLVAVFAVIAMLMVLGLLLTAAYTIRSATTSAPAPVVGERELADIGVPGPTVAEAPLPILALGDWLVDEGVRAPRTANAPEPRNAEEDARLLDQENELYEQSVLQNGGNFDHIAEMRERAWQSGPDSLEAKRTWNAVLRGNLRAKGLLQPQDRR